MEGPNRWLEGVVVLDLTRYLAGPACTRLLVELGAEVIKIEHPPYGDPNRGNRPRINRRAGAHIQQNRGKRSLCLDINTDAGSELIRELVPHVDVVVENFSPGVLARKGLSYEDLAALRAGLIMASVSGFGQVGPLAHRPCFDLIAQAYAGVMHMTGEPDGPPQFAGLGLADTNAGVHAFAAIGHALFHRERTGEGTHLDIAMVDSLFHMQQQAVHQASMDPDGPQPIRAGRDFVDASPAGTFRGPQGWIVVMCLEAQMPYLWAAMGRPELADDDRFTSVSKRIENRAALTELIETWMSGFDSDDDVMVVLERERVPHGPALSPAATLEHHHFVERGVIRTVQDPLAGEVQLPAFPFRSSSAFPADDHVAPALGQHNHEVLAELLGMSGARVAELEESGVLGSKPH